MKDGNLTYLNPTTYLYHLNGFVGVHNAEVPRYQVINPNQQHPSTTVHTTNVFTIEITYYTHYLGHLFIYHVAFWPNMFEEIELKDILFLKAGSQQAVTCETVRNSL